MKTNLFRRSLRGACALGLACAMTMGALSVQAAEPTTQTQTFATEAEAKAWIESFDTSKYEVTSDIQAQTISGVTAQAHEKDMADGTLDGYYMEIDETTGAAVYYITGGLETITVDDSNAARARVTIQPGDSISYTIQFVNVSGDVYENVGDTHTNSTLNFYGGGSMSKAINSVGKFDPTYKWILAQSGLDSFSTAQYTYKRVEVALENIPEGSEITDVEKYKNIAFNESNYQKYFHVTNDTNRYNNKYYIVDRTVNSNYVGLWVTEENVLAYYNAQMESSYTDIATAWNDYFYAKCFSLKYSSSLDDVVLNGQTPYTVNVTAALDGGNTDNMYQQAEWGWTDTVTFTCPKKTQYVATVNLKEKPSKTTEETKKTNKTQTSTATNANLFISLGAAGLTGAAFLSVLKRKQK